ncbi:hypothetical protein B0H13DRAFT_2477116 [Mycena leptocephala]|nr:hypothetical protein B0H13DRAFT_2477116 [Mycena leptocephala]
MRSDFAADIEPGPLRAAVPVLYDKWDGHVDLNGLFRGELPVKIYVSIIRGPHGAEGIFEGRSKLPQAKCLQRIHKIKRVSAGGIAISCILAIWLLSADTMLVQVGDETTIDYGHRLRIYLRRIREGLRDKKAWAIGLFEYWDRILFPNADKDNDYAAVCDELEDDDELDNIFSEAPSITIPRFTPFGLRDILANAALTASTPVHTAASSLPPPLVISIARPIPTAGEPSGLRCKTSTNGAILAPACSHERLVEEMKFYSHSMFSRLKPITARDWLNAVSTGLGFFRHASNGAFPFWGTNLSITPSSCGPRSGNRTARRALFQRTQPLRSSEFSANPSIICAGPRQYSLRPPHTHAPGKSNFRRQPAALHRKLGTASRNNFLSSPAGAGANWDRRDGDDRVVDVRAVEPGKIGDDVEVDGARLVAASTKKP